MSRLLAVLLGALCTAGLARTPKFGEYSAVMESLSGVHPRFREYWMRSRGYDPAEFQPAWGPVAESTGLRLVGKWGRGPSVEVTGRDSLVALTLGSEVALLNFAAPAQPVVLSEIQLDFMPVQSELVGSLLLVGGRGMEAWNVGDPARPARVSRFQRGAGDFCVQDSLVCFVRLDTFWVYSIGVPANPRPLGFYRDSGYVLAASGSIVVAGHPNAGLFFIDISNPALPRRVGAYSSDFPLAAQARGNLCCVSFQSNVEPYPIRFVTLDISNPASVRQLARIDSAGGYDIYLWDTLAFASGRDRAYREEFQIISIADSAQPRMLGRGATPHDNWGVWACPPRNRAYVADRSKGLSVFDIADLSRPVRDTAVLVADLAYDVAIDGNRAYVADYVGGLRILDVSDPTRPVELGGYDSLESTCRSVVAADSFAFLGWNPNPFFRCILTSDPARPVVVGSGAVQTIPEDMVLRDTLVYLAGNLRFNVVNVARPRQPVLVGSCNLGGDVWDMDMEGDLAYVTSSYFTIIDAARPDSPRVICQWERATAVDVVDTIAYQAYGGLRTVSVANPTSPYLLDSVSVYDITSDVIVIDTLAIVSGYKLHLFNVADPRDIRKVGEWTAPGWGRRLRYSAPYIYAGCFGAGVCILETVTVGMSERAGARPLPSVRLGATLVSGGVELAVQVKGGGPIGIRLFDVTGRMALTRDERGTPGDLTRLRVSVRELPAGVYLVQVRADGTVNTLRFTKVPGR